MLENPFSLVNKKILVTGASSGIGREIAIKCSGMGAAVIITGRDEKRLAETFSLLKGENHYMIAADLTKEQGILVESISVLNGIVLAAGILEVNPFLFLKEDELKRIFEINFFSPLSLAKQLLKNRILINSGSIVFISSLAGNIITSKGNTSYASSKSALTSAARTMALELASKGIRVNSVLPGMVRTPMLESFLRRLAEDQLIEDEKKYPLGYGTPADVANAAIFLLSDASRWMTGSSIVIDGGFSLQ